LNFPTAAEEAADAAGDAKIAASEQAIKERLAAGQKTSPFKGVSWVKQSKRWKATLRRNLLGHFADEEEAARAYDDAVRQRAIQDEKKKADDDLPENVPVLNTNTVLHVNFPTLEEEEKNHDPVSAAQAAAAEAMPSSTKQVSEAERARAVGWVVKRMVLYVERQAKDEIKRKNAATAVMEKIIRTLEKDKRQADAMAKKNAKIAREVKSKVDEMVRKVVAQHEWQEQKAIEEQRQA
jgi:hypothetical protein